MYQRKYNKNLPINKILKDLKGGNTSQDLDINEFDIDIIIFNIKLKILVLVIYSINFIVRLVGGETFDEITKNITRDDFMNGVEKLILEISELN